MHGLLVIHEGTLLEMKNGQWCLSRPCGGYGGGGQAFEENIELQLIKLDFLWLEYTSQSKIWIEMELRGIGNLNTKSQCIGDTLVMCGFNWISTGHQRKLGTSKGWGLIRGVQGEILGLFVADCGITSSTKDEVLAILKGLTLAWNKGMKIVILEVDSMVVTGLLLGELDHNSPNNYHIIHWCDEMVRKQGWKVEV